MSCYYFSRADYRHDMRDPYGSARAHAICRRLCGLPQASVTYGVLYWAACAATSHQIGARRYRRYRECWQREAERGLTERMQRKLWAWALRRVGAVRREALALPHSMQW